MYPHDDCEPRALYQVPVAIQRERQRAVPRSSTRSSICRVPCIRAMEKQNIEDDQKVFHCGAPKDLTIPINSTGSSTPWFWILKNCFYLIDTVPCARATKTDPNAISSSRTAARVQDLLNQDSQSECQMSCSPCKGWAKPEHWKRPKSLSLRCGLWSQKITSVHATGSFAPWFWIMLKDYSFDRLCSRSVPRAPRAFKILKNSISSRRRTTVVL